MNEKLKEKDLILGGLILHRMKFPNDPQKEFRQEMIERISWEILVIKSSVKKQPL